MSLFSRLVSNKEGEEAVEPIIKPSNGAGPTASHDQTNPRKNILHNITPGRCEATSNGTTPPSSKGLPKVKFAGQGSSFRKAMTLKKALPKRSKTFASHFVCFPLESKRLLFSGKQTFLLSVSHLWRATPGSSKRLPKSISPSRQ